MASKNSGGIANMLARATGAPGGADPTALKLTKKQLADTEQERDAIKADRDRLAQAITALRSEREGGTVSERMPLADFIEPPWNCWETTDKRVRELAEDIRRRGLLEPILIDVENIVLAGKHRILALQVLEQEEGDWFQATFAEGVPYFRHNISYREDPFGAGLLQLAANFNREKTPTAQELRPHLLALVEKMPRERYHFGKGRPAKGTQPVIPVLMEAFGVSRSTIARALAGDDSTAADMVGAKTKAEPSRLIRYKRVVKQASSLSELIHELPPELRQDDEITAWLRQTQSVLKRMDRLVTEERAAR